MISKREIIQDNGSQDSGRVARRQIISEYFVYLDPDRWGPVTQDDLFIIVEKIRLKTGESAQAAQAYIEKVKHEKPVLATPIEGLGLTVSEFLERVAREEYDFPIRPLSANRQIPPGESIKY